MPRIRPDAPEASAGPAEPPRAPYQGYRPVLPPIPDQCPRCCGLVVIEYEDVRCLCCGWYLQPIPLPQETNMMKSGASLPKVVEIRR